MDIQDPPQIEEPVTGDPPPGQPESPEPPPRPSVQPSDPHKSPLDDPEDAKWLTPDDARRQQIESD